MNFGTPVPLIIGVVLIVGAIALFFLDKIKPGCRRDSDNVYAFLGLLAGVILLAHLGMEFTLSLQQMIVVGMLVALMIENIQNRVPGSRPVRQSGNRDPYDDEYRPRRSQRSSMRAEAQLEFDDDRIPPSPSRTRRIRGEGERRSSRDNYAQRGRDYEDESQASYARGSRRRPNRSDDAYEQDNYGSYGSYDEDLNKPSSPPPNQNIVEERPRRRRPLQLKGEIDDKTYTPDDYSSAVKAVRNRRRKNSSFSDDSNAFPGEDADNAGSGDSYGENGNSDYVDYKPLDLPKYPGPQPGSDDSNSDGSY